jgi:hypothetical protein
MAQDDQPVRAAQPFGAICVFSEQNDMSATAETAVEIAGALMILVPFALNLFLGFDRHGAPYLLLNLLGSAILTVLATIHQQWGFVVLQFVWAVVALWGLIALWRRKPTAT